MDFLQIKRALLSVTHKDGLIDFATFLHKHNVELVSTGGTLSALTAANLPVTPVSKVTGFPEILDGRVKTLHPHIHAGILANKNLHTHKKTLQDFNIKPFDLVCVNLYDFENAIANPNTSLNELIEEIDIGGPCMLRAAAKNFQSILVIPSTDLYTASIKELETHNLCASLAFRHKTAARAFSITANYDQLITAYLTKTSNQAL